MRKKVQVVNKPEFITFRTALAMLGTKLR